MAGPLGQYTLGQGHVKDKIPAYTMGTGHVKFFYDKGKYLYLRTLDLYHECKKRGFNVEQKIYRHHPKGLDNLWFPDDLARAINLARIGERIQEKPHLYTWYGHKIYNEDGSIPEFIEANIPVPSLRKMI